MNMVRDVLSCHFTLLSASAKLLVRNKNVEVTRDGVLKLREEHFMNRFNTVVTGFDTRL